MATDKLLLPAVPGLVLAGGAGESSPLSLLSGGSGVPSRVPSGVHASLASDAPGASCSPRMIASVLSAENKMENRNNISTIPKTFTVSPGV